MTFTIPNQWTATAADADAEITTAPTTNNWLITVVAWRVTDGSAPIMSLGDFSRNLWQLAFSATTPAWGINSSAQLQVQVWMCPAVRYDGWPVLNVYAAAMQISASDVGWVAINVAEVGGFVNGTPTIDSVTLATASSATALSLAIPAPAANCFMIAAAAIDTTTPTMSVTSAGWAALTQVSNSGGVLMAPQWVVSTGTQTASWSSSAAANWVGVGVAIRETGTAPAQPNSAWAVGQWLVGLGYQQGTPLSAVRWTDQTNRLVEVAGQPVISAPRGIPYDQGVVQSSPANLLIRNDDGAYTPRTPGNGAANAAGTTTTIVMANASATNINPSDFFQLQTAGGALKEFTVFQVTAVNSVGGATTVTFGKADGTGGGAQVATASGDVYAGIPIDIGIPWQYLMTWQNKTYPVATGWFSELPQEWTDPHWGRVPAVGYDVLAPLAKAQNPTAMRGEILRRQPYAYWPLGDAQGAGLALNASKRSLTQLVQTTSKWGPGSGAADFGASTQGLNAGPSFPVSLTGDPGTGWAQTGLVSADLPQKGAALVGADSNFPPLAGGVTIVGCLLVTNSQQAVISGSTVDPTVFILRNSNPNAGATGSVLKLAINHTNPNIYNPQVTVWDQSTHATTTYTATSGGPLTGGLWVLWAVAFNRTYFMCYNSNNAVVGAAALNMAASFSTIDIGGEADQFNNGRALPGLLAHIAVFPRMLTQNEITVNLFGAMNYGQPRTSGTAETPGRRIQRKLATVNSKIGRVLNSSDVLVDAEGADGGAVAAIASTIAGYEDGLWFADAAGVRQFRGRAMAYQQTPRAVLGENTAAGEIPYEPNIQVTYDSTFIYNQVQVSNSALSDWGFPVATTFTASDDTSANVRYTANTLPRSTRMLSSGDVFDLAWWLLAKYAYPKMRVQQVTIDASKDPSRWAFCLGVEVGDLVTVNRRQIGAPMISQQCRVLQVTPSVGPGVATWTLTLQPAPPTVTILNDPTRGVVGTTVVGA